MDGMTKPEKIARLMTAYRRLPPDGRDTLDKTVRDLAALPTLPGRTAPPEKAAGESPRIKKG
ncbi:hypothetical protein FACS189442_4060 [Spirochaetia bacterium]|nr:hypothetical protein FACS189442_4060 [Spirochaetia bacterium]